MRSGPIRTAAAFLLLALAGCTSPSPACTEIGSPSGIRVVVVDDLAGHLTRLGLDVCSDGKCRTVPVELTPGMTTRADDCPMASDDSSCSATAVPDGTLVGFAAIDELTAGHTSVGATATIAGKQRTFGPITLDVTTTYPNGQACPAGGNQGSLEVRRTGLVG